MIGIQSGIDWAVLVLVYLALFGFGWGYNAIIKWAEEKDYMEGYTAEWVVGGVLGTIGLTAFISPVAAAIFLGAFACSGGPMVIGSGKRHRDAIKAAKKAKQDETERLRQEALSYDAEEEVAP